MNERNRSSTIDRRRDILHKINETGQVLIPQLSKEYIVSEVTIRNDLKQLENKKLLIRARGGAIKLENGVGIDYHLSAKGRLYYAEKARIGKKAAELIKENDTVILDSGTTTMAIAKNLGNLYYITVICNALNIINQLSFSDNINLIVPGGYLRKHSLSFVGPLAEKTLQNLFVDKVFIGVDGFDSKIGIFTPNLEEAYLNEIMIRISKEVIVVCDSSKFLKKSLAFICGISRIHCVITDSGISEEDKKRLEEAGIKVLIT